MRKAIASEGDRDANVVGWLLTADELISLTGYRMASAQRRWLDQVGLRYVVDASGRPRVAREAVDRLLGVAVTRSATHDPSLRVVARVAPNFAALTAFTPAGHARPGKRAGGKHGA